MSSNTIVETSHRIRFRETGSVELVGIEQDEKSVVILVTGIDWLCATIDDIEVEFLASFKTEGKFFRSLDNQTWTLIFSVKTNGPIRNPRKFLRAIRSKLNGIGSVFYSKFLEEDRDHYDMFGDIDRGL